MLCSNFEVPGLKKTILCKFHEQGNCLIEAMTVHLRTRHFYSDPRPFGDSAFCPCLFHCLLPLPADRKNKTATTTATAAAARFIEVCQGSARVC